MDLLDRYLLTVRRNLPSALADDITAELREELLDQIEAREARIGHPLDEAETAGILKAFGHPYVIAARYREHQYLIGPQAYPFYIYALRVVVVITLAVFVFSAITPLLMGGDNAARAFVHGAGKAWDTLFTAFAIVTILLAMFERRGFPAAHLKAWNPETLPDVDQKPRGKWTSPIEVGIGLLALLWWAGGLPFPLVGLPHGLAISGSALWSQLYWPILALGIALLANNGVAWLRPEWLKLRTLLGLGTTVAALWLLSYLRANGPLLEVHSADMEAAALAKLGATLNSAFHVLLTIALIAWGIRLVTLVYQLYLRRFIMGR